MSLIRYRLLLAIILSVGFLSPVHAGESWWEKLKTYFGYTPDSGTPTESPGQDKLPGGVRLMLLASAESTMGRLGRYNGFMADPDVHISLPPAMQKARNIMARFGLSARLDSLEQKLNRAAEIATNNLVPIFKQAAQNLTLIDAMEIIGGGDRAATTYFRRETEAKLRPATHQAVKDGLQATGAYTVIAQINETLSKFPMAPDLKTDITNYVTDQTLDAIFLYMGNREKYLRDHPEKAADQIVRQILQR